MRATLRGKEAACGRAPPGRGSRAQALPAAALALLLGGLMVIAPLAAQSGAAPLGPLPAGWTTALTDVIAVFSKPTGAGTVTIIAPPVMTAEGDIRNAIVELAPRLVEDLFGEPRPAGDLISLPASEAVAPGLFLPLRVELEDGTEARVEVTGFQLSRGRLQLFLLAAPPNMPDDNGELQTARTLIDRWRAAGLLINADLTSKNAPAAVNAQSEDAASDGKPVSPAATEKATPDDAVENVIHFLRYAFDAQNPSAAADPVPVTALLLKDGRVFEGVRSAPEDFDPATRPPGSAGTGRWQLDGEAYALAFADGTQGTAVAGPAKTFAAPASLLFTGTFRALGGKAAGVLADEISFYPDGSLLLKTEGSVRSGTYFISGRTARLGPADEPGETVLFGFRGEMATPSLLILGNRIYERTD